MTNRVKIPAVTEWKEVWYHPQPFITRIRWGEDKTWQEEVPGCKIEVIPEDLGFMRGLTNGIKVKIIYPDDKQEMYVVPLSEMHMPFWDYSSEVIGVVYPWPKREFEKISKLRMKINSILAKTYWDKMDYKKYTPQEWATTLNNILDFIENNKIKNEENQLIWLTEQLEKIIK